MRILTTPFVAALGARLDEAETSVRHHHSCIEPQRFRGAVRVRARGFAGRILAALLGMGAWRNAIKPRPAVEIPFELQNEIVNLGGRCVMIWRRILHFPRGTQTYEGRLSFDARRRSIIDSMGLLEVELVPTVVRGELLMTSRAQRLLIGGRWISWPGRLIARAETREWKVGPDLHLKLAIRSFFFGEMLSYEASFRESV